MQSLFRLLTLLLLSGLSASVSATNVLDISDSWQVRLGNDTTLHTIQLPSTTDAAGLGVPNTLEPALAKPQLVGIRCRILCPTLERKDNRTTEK